MRGLQSPSPGSYAYIYDGCNGTIIEYNWNRSSNDSTVLWIQGFRITSTHYPFWMYDVSLLPEMSNLFPVGIIPAVPMLEFAPPEVAPYRDDDYSRSELYFITAVYRINKIISSEQKFSFHCIITIVIDDSTRQDCEFGEMVGKSSGALRLCPSAFA